MSDKKQLIIRALLQTLVIGVIGFLLSLFIGLSQGGFDSFEILNQYNFYISGSFFLLLTFMAFITEQVITKDDSKYGNSVAYVSNGKFPHLSIFKDTSPFQLFLLSLIFFSIVGFFFVQTNQTTFTGLAVLEQQFTATSSVLFSSALIPISENAGFALMIALILIFLKVAARKYNWGKTNYLLVSWSTVLVSSGLYGYSVHLLRYVNSSVALGTVWLFWTIGGILTMATGSFIPFWVMHLINNFLFDIQRYISNDTTIFIMIGLLLLSIVTYIYLYGFTLKSKKVTNE